MFLIVGLGNPGKKYEGTRHNFGFQVLDLLASGQEWENKYESELVKLTDVILCKPQTFMNESGRAVKEILKYYPEAQLVVLHDELDLPFGTLKIQKDISAAGHNGVQSLIDELGTKDFIRIRLGVEKENRVESGESFVLQKFLPEEQELVAQMLEQAKNVIETIQTQGFNIAQSKYNG